MKIPRPPKIVVINVPQTTTILALGFLAGNLLFLPMIANLGDQVSPDFRPLVANVFGLFKDGMLLILGFYFAKVTASPQDKLTQSLADKLPPQPTGGPDDTTNPTAVSKPAETSPELTPPPGSIFHGNGLVTDTNTSVGAPPAGMGLGDQTDPRT